MSFTQGFEKTAWSLNPARIVGGARGLVSGATKGVKKLVKEHIGAQKVRGVESYRSMAGSGSKAPGGNLARVRAKKIGKKKVPSAGQVAKQTPKAQSDVMSRYNRAQDSKLAKKPSFARKHPILAAGGLYLGARAVMGGGSDDSQRPGQPSVTPGQY